MNILQFYISNITKENEVIEKSVENEVIEKSTKKKNNENNINIKDKE
jgi:hypothetical protein